MKVLLCKIIIKLFDIDLERLIVIYILFNKFVWFFWDENNILNFMSFLLIYLSIVYVIEEMMKLIVEGG